MSLFPDHALALAKPIRLLLTDIDGCWTDGGIQLLPGYGELVRFHVHDGMAVQLLRRAGVEVAAISGRDVPAVRERLAALQVEEAHLGKADKTAWAQQVVQDRGLDRTQVAAFGDDLLDFALFDVAGLSAAPANAVPSVSDRADFVTTRRGGDGALRELADLILAAKA